MAIGTTAAILGVAAISAGASALSGSAANRATDRAADAQAAASREATAAQREARNQNVAIQQPFLNTGMGAMNQMNALLGITPVQGSQGSGGIAGGGSGQTEDQWAQQALNALRAEVNPSLWSQVNGIQDPSDRLAALEPLMFRRDREVYGQFTAGNPRPMNNGNVTAPPPAVATNPDGTQQTPQQAAQAAYDVFKNSTGYQSRLTEANNALNSQYAGRSTLQSGAAMIDMARMNQDYASNEFGQYFNMLGGQQQVGVGAANALSGVNTNYANNAANIAMNNGNNQANAAIQRGNNTMGMIQGIGSSFGNALGAFSDRRLKRDIALIRTRADGLNVYSWIYKSDPTGRVYEGHMADEVREIYPTAHIANYNGTDFAGVNYAAIPREEIAA